MYLKSLQLQNFRGFRNSQIIEFNDGLNVLVGENDSGKSAIIDAIRIVLGATDQSWYRIELSDFSNEDNNLEIKIVCKFCDLTADEQAAFLECLSYETEDAEQFACLYLHWTCKYLLNFSPPRTSTSISSGIKGDGQAPTSEARELLRVTYLRPLRDAYSNMQSGRNSRLSQIMMGIPDLNQGTADYTPDMDLHSLSLTGIADLTNKLLADHPTLKNTNRDIVSILTDKMLLKGDGVTTSFEVSGTDVTEAKKLSALLEKLDLSAQKDAGKGRVGLGTSNILSMACELLLSRDLESSFLLIEEPEAHIHAQRQLRLIQSLQDSASKTEYNHQIILTTHSPLLASVVKLENIIIIKTAKSYPLSSNYTNLEKDDYAFLECYLDATKSNLFFAKGIVIVEGASEELLLPTIAKVLNRDFTEHGISVVNVRGVGLRRYAKIFQRSDAQNPLDIKVACITDRDIMPDCAPRICLDNKYIHKTQWPTRRRWKTESDLPTQADKEEHLSKIKERADGQNVKTFISTNWTFEYDLALSGLADDLIEAIVNVKYAPANRESEKADITTTLGGFESAEEKASYIYSFFTMHSTSKAEVAQQLAAILERNYKDDPQNLERKLPLYLVDAIKYVT